MFTGIITDIGRVTQIDTTRGDKRFTIQTTHDMSHVPLGASIACSGCCLSVVDRSAKAFSVDVSAESLSRTTLAQWQEGTQVNLETSLKLGDELGGHLVFGHVDGLALLEQIDPDGDSYRLKLTLPQELSHLIAAKGSVSLDGISLTVNEVEGAQFGVNIIPHTWEVTTLRHRQIGDALNLEIDMLARYVARILDKERI